MRGKRYPEELIVRNLKRYFKKFLTMNSDAESYERHATSMAFVIKKPPSLHFYLKPIF